VTLKDIAELAQTSVSTVSRSLNDSDLISPATRERIKAIAREQGFQFNAIARGLATNSVGTIGVILPEHFDRFDVLMYHAALHSDLRKSLEQADLDIIVAFKDNRFSGLNNIERLVNRRKVDGLIIVRSSLDRETEDFLRHRGIPFVLTHYPPDDRRIIAGTEAHSAHSSEAHSLNTFAVDAVWSDNREGGRLVAAYLKEKGISSVALLTGGEDQESLHRLEGFQAELTPEIIIPCSWGIEAATEAIIHHQSRIPRGGAIFAFNDLMAFGALQGLSSLHLRVPDDVLLVGYDDTPLAAATIPGITSVHQAHEEIAHIACNVLLEQIRVGNTGTQDSYIPQTVALPPYLVERSSTKRNI